MISSVKKSVICAVKPHINRTEGNQGSRQHAENYRPISLLSLVSKVLERCVFNNIKDHLFELIKTCQHGFITGRSCVTNLIEALDYIGSLLDSGGQIDTVYLDMSKAFDKINHKRLIHKLRMSGFGGSLLQWFRDCRQQGLCKKSISEKGRGLTLVTCIKRRREIDT